MKRLFSFLKKISVITLVLMMVLGSVDAIAYAAEATNNTMYIEETCVNPRFYDYGAQGEMLSGGHETAVKYDAQDNGVRIAAYIIKDNMVARNENFSVTIKTTRSDYSNIVKEAFGLAISEELAETPVEGDYLAWQYGGYTFSGSARVLNGLYEFTFNFKVPYYTTPQEEAQVTIAVQNALEELELDNLNEYEKVKAIYDYVCRVCDYDYSGKANDYKKFSAYGAIVNHTAVCQGYSLLLYRLLKEVNIDNKIVTSTSHSWNIIQVDNEYYNTDATWDDNYFDYGLNYKYFLTCGDHFDDHQREPQYRTDEFNIRHNMAQACYYDQHPELAPKPTAAKPQAPQGIQRTQAPVCTEHQYAVGKIVDATCTKAGYRIDVCQICKAEKKVTLPAKGHTKVVDKAVKATFAKEGKTEGAHCAVCNAVIVAQKTVAKLKVKGITLNKLTAKSKGFGATWTKSENATGYEVQYSTDKKFTAKKTKTTTIKKNGTTNKKVSKLKGNTKYYIRVRAYKTENGKKYYSSWTTVKNVKTKK